MSLELAGEMRRGSADFMVGRSASGCNKPGYKAATHPVMVGTHEKPSQTGGVHIKDMLDKVKKFAKHQSSGIFDLTSECRERLINIELKVDGLLAGDARIPQSQDPFKSFAGSPDQGFGHITFSQFGEDLIIANILALLGTDKPVYLDVGANHPIRPGDLALNVGVAPERGEFSFYFIDDFSGRNTFSKDSAEGFINSTPDFSIQKVQTIQTLLLGDIIDRHLHGKWPDLLTIDIEGFDYDVIKTTNFNGVGPLVLCVESRTGDNKNEPVMFAELVRSKGYRPVFQTWGNLIAVREDTASQLSI